MVALIFAAIIYSNNKISVPFVVYVENKVDVKLWQAVPDAKPLVAKCEGCKMFFAAKFSLLISSKVWRLTS